jgi:oligopeptidase B
MEEIILDENELVLNSSIFVLGVLAVSPDSKLLAYSIDRTGDDRYSIWIIILIFESKVYSLY